MDPLKILMLRSLALKYLNHKSNMFGFVLNILVAIWKMDF